MHTISNEELQAINLLEQVTGAHAKDAVISEDSIIFVVEKGELGRAIGKQGASINRLRKAFGRGVEVVEEASELQGFLANVFAPAQIRETRVSDVQGRRVATVVVDPKNKGLAIGRGGERVRKARLLAKRHFGMDDVKII